MVDAVVEVVEEDDDSVVEDELDRVVENVEELDDEDEPVAPVTVKYA